MSLSLSGSPCPIFHGAYRTSDPPKFSRLFFNVITFITTPLQSPAMPSLPTGRPPRKVPSLHSLLRVCTTLAKRRVDRDLFAELYAKHHSTLPLKKFIRDLPYLLPSFPPVKQHRSALEEPSDDVFDVINSLLRFHVYLYAVRGPFNHAITLRVYIGERSSIVFESLRIALLSSTRVPTAASLSSFVKMSACSNQLVSRNTSPSLPQTPRRSLSSA